VRVASEHAALAGGEAVVLERAGAVRLGRVERRGRDEQVERGRRELRAVIGDRRGQLDQDGQVVELPRAVHVDGAHEDLAGRGEGEDPAQAEQDVVRGERLAVVEGDARPQLDRPFGERAVSWSDLLGQQVLHVPGLYVERDQWLVEGLQPGDVDVGDALVRVESVRRRPAGEADLQVSAVSLALPGAYRLRRAATAARSQEASGAGRHAGAGQPGQDPAAGYAGLQYSTAIWLIHGKGLLREKRRARELGNGIDYGIAAGSPCLRAPPGRHCDWASITRRLAHGLTYTDIPGQRFWIVTGYIEGHNFVKAATGGVRRT
jgi:hypothetical protein